MTMMKAGQNGEQAQQQALVPYGGQAVALSPYEPQTYEQALALATTFSKATTGDLRLTPEQVFLKMATGRELGIPSTAALRAIDCADYGRGNQITLRAQLMVALCLKARGVCEYFEFVEGDAEKATYRAKRVGRPEQTETYTIEQARKAKLVKTDGAWDKDPASQLIARSSSRLARRVFPDLILNLYTEDEIRELSVIEVREVPDVQPLTPRTVTSTATAPAGGGGPSPEDRAADWERRLRAAASLDEGKKVGKEIQDALPNKEDPTRKRLLGVFAECKAAGWAKVATSTATATSEPAHDPTTGEVKPEPTVDREPGDE